VAKKRSKGSSKGSSFEREICRQLSLWWTNQVRDDIFWRASQSGGRATTRSKIGKSTANSAGDIAYLDVAGKPFLDKVCIEIKRGYSARSDTTGLIDSIQHGQPLLLKFFEQAERSRINANVPYWMLIQKRDRRESLVHFPCAMLFTISKFLGTSYELLLQQLKYAQVTIYPCTTISHIDLGIVSTPLVSFFDIVPPDFFNSLSFEGGYDG
jgi:hypothetical protein